MNVRERLAEFEEVEAAEAEPLDTSFADRFLKTLTRIAKAQMKTEQAASFSADAVQEHLSEHADLADSLKRERDAAQEQQEQLARFVLEVVDLMDGLVATLRTRDNQEAREVAEEAEQALERHMQKIGLTRVSALGEEPDGMYHYVLDTRAVEDAEEVGQIVEVARPGFVLNGTVLRKADVIVGEK